MRELCKKIVRISTALLSAVLLAACGQEEVMPSSLPAGEELLFFSAGEGTGMELVIEKNALYDAAPEVKGANGEGRLLYMQFYQGEAVQLWASAPYRENGQEYVSVYMYRQDGSRETCIDRIDWESGRRICFRDSQGCFYSISRGLGNDNDSIVRMDSSGKVLYTAKIEGDRGSIQRICELADGRLAVLVYKGSGRTNYGMVLLDGKGKTEIVELSELPPGQPCCMGISQEGLFLISEERLYRVELPGGKLEPLFSFAPTTYLVYDVMNPVAAFCLGGNGKLELLRSDLQNEWSYETLGWRKKDEGRQEVVLRAWSLKNNNFLKEQVLKFNSISERYQVVLEGAGEGESLSDYRTRTGVELAAGKGPDLLENILIEFPGSLIEKEILADLAPFMNQAGIKEEDYFPLTFGIWRTGDSIYNIRFASSLTERTIVSSVLGDVAEPDIETLADALLAYPENAVYDIGFSGRSILRELLEGSQTLWGMVDWENGSCDFGGDLFRKLLEVSKKYQYDKRNNYPLIFGYRDFSSFQHLYLSPTEEEARANGNVPLGQLFDDGLHPVGLGSGMSFWINANAVNKEGAWEFLRFLLSDEVQESLMEDFNKMPAMKSVFWKVAEDEIKNGPTEKYGKGLFTAPLSREKAEEVAALLENARALPYNTETILEIVLEESQDYFDGSKEIPQVVDAIENKVGLYLQERR